MVETSNLKFGKYGFDSRHPYQNYKIYGPYTSKKDGRQRCVLVDNLNKKTTVSYPKLLMELHLKRKLDTNETIHHIDKNFTNNSINNLQVIDRKAHSKLHAVKLKDINTTCMQCKNKILLTGKKLRHFVSNQQRKNKSSAGPFCDRKCSGKYNANIGHKME